MQLKTGKPCKRCGGRERYLSNRKCISCSRKDSAKWRRFYPDRHLEYQTQYRKRLDEKRAMPPWADKEAMDLFYKEAEKLTDRTGVEFVVVHHVPIRGRTVCGLHVEHNLRIASKSWVRLRRFHSKKEDKELMQWLRERGLAR